MEESFKFHLNNLLLVIHVFLKILYCKSLASGILDVLASFLICFSIWSCGIWYSQENFSRVAQCLWLKDFGNRVSSSSLQPYWVWKPAKLGQQQGGRGH